MAQSTDGKRWVRTAILVGVIYFVIGTLLGELANRSASEARFAWRLTAWIVSAAVYAAHIAYEHFKLRNAPRNLALHVATAVALAGFLLALAATIHALRVPLHVPLWLYLIALVTWPILTGVPAFLVAFVAGWVLTNLPRRA